ncbi:MAG TPA: metalloregulator ArsR/SmtB family transcription factor [Flavisolibacter sp.]|nr:metalloregulator ArsR/SmtB family transcription factor [Flavisolibacter sp.]
MDKWRDPWDKSYECKFASSFTGSAEPDPVRSEINHKLRRQILQLIHTNGKMMVMDIYKKINLEQSGTSAHLSILRRHAMVDRVRKGTCVYYSINYQQIKLVEALAVELMKTAQQPVKNQPKTESANEQVKTRRESWLKVVKKMVEEGEFASK